MNMFVKRFLVQNFYVTTHYIRRDYCKNEKKNVLKGFFMRIFPRSAELSDVADNCFLFYF